MQGGAWQLACSLLSLHPGCFWQIDSDSHQTVSFQKLVSDQHTRRLKFWAKLRGADRWIDIQDQNYQSDRCNLLLGHTDARISSLHDPCKDASWTQWNSSNYDSNSDNVIIMKHKLTKVWGNNCCLNPTFMFGVLETQSPLQQHKNILNIDFS